MSNSTDIIWRTAESADLPANLQDWMLHAGSFVERLKAHGVSEPRIEVLQQCWRLPTIDEGNCLQLDLKDLILAREVLIVSEEKKWMYARTIFPATTITGAERELANLKNKSLGSVLFKDPHLQRSQFEVSCLASGMAEHAMVLAHAQMSADDLWARRSVFTTQQKTLLLTEVFLPDIETL